MRLPVLKIMWFCVIIVVVLLGVATLIQSNSANPPITFQRFSEEMLKNHDVDHITTYKSGDLLVAEVFLKKESINKPEYADAKKADKSILATDDDSTSPQYVFQAATFDGLSKQINDAETSFGYAEADKISVGIESGHETLLSNWFVQCVIMFIVVYLFISAPICGFLGYRAGKKRMIGPRAGMLWGIFLGPFGLIIIFLAKKIPPQKNGGIRV